MLEGRSTKAPKDGNYKIDIRILGHSNCKVPSLGSSPKERRRIVVERWLLATAKESAELEECVTLWV